MTLEGNLLIKSEGNSNAIKILAHHDDTDLYANFLIDLNGRLYAINYNYNKNKKGMNVGITY